MATFEKVGKRIDDEMRKLRRFYETEVRPTTKRRLGAALRSAATRLAKLAREVEGRQRARARRRAT